MKLELIRRPEWSSDKSTIGELSVNGVNQCFVLEPPKLHNGKENVRGKCCIPQGSYAISITHSPRFKRDLPELSGVPGRAEILIHPGNEAEDTQGCLLPGLYRGKDFVGQSRKAFDALFEAMAAAKERNEKIDIEIREEAAL